MTIDKRSIKPQPNAIATDYGWVNPINNELLVSSKGLKTYLETLTNKEAIKENAIEEIHNRDKTEVYIPMDELPLQQPIMEDEPSIIKEDSVIAENVIKEPEVFSANKSKKLK